MGPQPSTWWWAYSQPLLKTRWMRREGENWSLQAPLYLSIAIVDNKDLLRAKGSAALPSAKLHASFGLGLGFVLFVLKEQPDKVIWGNKL